jgi:hypothetical protein
MERHTYLVFITHGVMVQFDHEPTESELYDMAVDVLLTRQKEQLVGASDFEVDKWDEEEM